MIAVIGVLGSKMLQDCTTCIAISDPTVNIGCAAESGAAEAISQHLLFWSEEGSVVDGSVAKSPVVHQKFSHVGCLGSNARLLCRCQDPEHNQ